MKTKTQYLIFIILLITYKAFSQNAINNMKKYIYYKQRFLEGFIHVGNNQGESIPFDVRINSYPTNDIKNKIGLGDATIRLGYYIATLATEYKLLKDNNQNTNQTLKELYFAFEAFNRLDYKAEGYFGGTEELNGFFIRDDVPVNFIYQPNHQHLINASPYSDLLMDSVVGDFIRASPQGPRHDNFHYCDEMSKDQMYTILWSMAMVKKCVDANANFNNELFLDGLTSSIRQEALEITRRIMDMLKEDDYKIRNPVFNTCVYWGDEVNINQHACWIGKNANCQDLSYGIASLASWILDEAPTSFYKWNTMIPLSYAETIWQYCGYNQILNFAENYKMIELAIVANNWFENNPTTYMMNAFHDIIYNTSGIEEIANINNLSLNCPQLINDTRLKVKQGSTVEKVQAPIFYLMYCFLHDKTPDLDFDDAHFENLLNVAPCKGPNNYGDGNYGDYEWSANDRWVHPEKRGLIDNNPSFGEYCGLDYMLLFNMYCLSDPLYCIGYGFNFLENRNIPATVTYPYLEVNSNTSPPTMFWRGSNTVPANIYTFNSITSAATVSKPSAILVGNVTYKSPSIRLTSGFNVKSGAKFHAIGLPLSCDANGLYRNYIAEDIVWSNGGKDSIVSNYNKVVQNTGTPPLVKKDFEPSLVSSVEPSPKEIDYEKPEIYPNPTNGFLNVSLNLPNSEKISLEINNSLGETVLKNETILNGNRIIKINLSDFSNGVYFLKVKSNTLDFNYKLIKY